MAGHIKTNSSRNSIHEEEFIGLGDQKHSLHRRSRSRSKSRTRLTAQTISLADENFYEDLENYIMCSQNDKDKADVWTQLQQKESDLLLAAELGKALLEKNEELKKEQDRIADEYRKKIEELEQEKHLLRRKLDSTQSEYEARILELQNDIKSLTSKIDDKQSTVKQNEREKASLIAELTAQNTRLTSQLKEASGIEAQLTAQLQSLKDQYSMRKSSLQDHVHSLDALKDELALVNDIKSDLEKRLHMAQGDKDNLTQQLEEATDRIMMLERQLKEQEILYHNTLKELERLQRSHDTLAERLGGESEQQTETSGPRSLQTEMDSGPDDCDENWLQAEALMVYQQLRTLVLHLHAGHDDDSGLHSDLSLTSIEVSSGESGREFSLRRGVLLAACEDACATASCLEGTRVRDSIAAHARRALERERQIDEKNEIIADLTSKLSVAEVELRDALERQQRALDDATSLQADMAVKKAREERDEAIERKKAAEIALAKTRVEHLQASSQLLEAVRQKADLAEQLEQWQSDMQELIDEQMKRKLTSQEKKRKLPVSSAPIAPTRASRLLGFFQR